MNNLQLTRMFAVLVSVQAVSGLFTTGHLFGITNTDALMDVMRVGLAAFLIYAGFVSKEESVLRAALLTTGIAYVMIGLLGLIAPTVGGLLPSGLTGFDVVFHLATGLLATWAGMRSRNRAGAHA